MDALSAALYANKLLPAQRASIQQPHQKV